MGQIKGEAGDVNRDEVLVRWAMDEARAAVGIDRGRSRLYEVKVEEQG